MTANPSDFDVLWGPGATLYARGALNVEGAPRLSAALDAKEHW
jgi:hypothetical protein